MGDRDGRGSSSLTMRNLCRLFLLVVLVFAPACSSVPSRPRPVYKEPLESTVLAYVAYAQGECERALSTLPQVVRPLSEPIEDSAEAEISASGHLLLAYCAEQRGSLEDAMEIYRVLTHDAPMSYAAGDARERLRFIRAERAGLDSSALREVARERALKGSSNRKPVERRSATFPPLPFLAELSGLVVVEFEVTASGETAKPIVVASEPPLLFDGAALRAIRTWRYSVDTDGSGSPRQAIRLLFRATEVDPDQSVPVILNNAEQ